MTVLKQRLKAVFFDIGDTLVSPSTRTWLNGAKTAVHAFKDSNLSLGIISNTGSLDRTQLKEYLPDDFSFADFTSELVVLSSEVKLEKPDLRIFLMAAELANAYPSECLFCGENLVENVVAQQAGFVSFRLGGDTAGDFEKLLELVLD